jgi:hypothetical protein
MRSTLTDPDSVPVVTWVLLAGALVVFAAAAIIGVRGGDGNRPKAASSAPNDRDALPSSTGEEGVDPLSTPSPLSITAELLDAETRSHLWNSEAVLASIQTVLGPGGAKTPVEIEFGVPKSNKLAGAPLGTDRLAVLYSNGRAVQTPRTGKANTLAASPPNCPLEVAALKTPLGKPTSGSVAVLYSFSKRHGRPIWHFTDNAGSVHRVDGHSCAILLH